MEPETARLASKEKKGMLVADVFLACSHCAADIRARRSAARASPPPHLIPFIPIMDKDTTHWGVFLSPPQLYLSFLQNLPSFLQLYSTVYIEQTSFLRVDINTYSTSNAWWEGTTYSFFKYFNKNIKSIACRSLACWGTAF